MEYDLLCQAQITIRRACDDDALEEMEPREIAMRLIHEGGFYGVADIESIYIQAAIPVEI